MDNNKQSPAPVQVVGVQIPFMDMVFILVKLAFAAIPAAIIISLIGVFIFAALTAFVRH